MNTPNPLDTPLITAFTSARRPQIWMVAANILNKQSRRGQPTGGGPPAWGLGDVLTTLTVKSTLLRKVFILL